MKQNALALFLIFLSYSLGYARDTQVISSSGHTQITPGNGTRYSFEQDRGPSVLEEGHRLSTISAIGREMLEIEYMVTAIKVYRPLNSKEELLYRKAKDFSTDRYPSFAAAEHGFLSMKAIIERLGEAEKKRDAMRREIENAFQINWKDAPGVLRLLDNPYQRIQLKDALAETLLNRELGEKFIKMVKEAHSEELSAEDNDNFRKILMNGDEGSPYKKFSEKLELEVDLVKVDKTKLDKILSLMK